MIRVVLLEDEHLVRSGIRVMLEAAGTIEVVAEAGDGTDCVDLVLKHRPDVVLTDIRMPKVDGLEVTRRVREMSEPPSVVVLTTFDLDEYVYTALQAGATGFLLKDTPPNDLVRGVEVAASGEATLAPAVTKRLLTRFAHGSGSDQTEARQRLAVLTDREREVAHAAATGASNAEIARNLYLSEPTVKTHVSRAMSKLGLVNRTQIAILVYQAGEL